MKSVAVFLCFLLFLQTALAMGYGDFLPNNPYGGDYDVDQMPAFTNRMGNARQHRLRNSFVHFLQPVFPEK